MGGYYNGFDHPTLPSASSFEGNDSVVKVESIKNSTRYMQRKGIRVLQMSNQRFQIPLATREIGYSKKVITRLSSHNYYKFIII